MIGVDASGVRPCHAAPRHASTLQESAMSEDVVRLAANPMTPADRRRLESYGSHVIQHGWATRFAWAEDGGGRRGSWGWRRV